MENRTTKLGRPRGLYAVDSHQLLYCKLPKVACTNWKRVFIYLNGKGNVTLETILNAMGRIVHGYYSARYFNRYGLKRRQQYTDEDVKHRLDNYFKFVFVRHPLDRLLSAYNSKFNTTKPFKKNYLRSYGPLIMEKFSSRNVTGIPDYITFEEFLRYIAGSKEKLNRHWAPYFELCTFCDPKWRYDFIGKYENMSEEANYLLDKWNISEFRFPSAYRSMEEEIVRFKNAFADIPTDVIDAIWKRYNPDFILFNYKNFPDFIFK